MVRISVVWSTQYVRSGVQAKSDDTPLLFPKTWRPAAFVFFSGPLAKPPEHLKKVPYLFIPPLHLLEAIPRDIRFIRSAPDGELLLSYSSLPRQKRHLEGLKPGFSILACSANGPSLAIWDSKLLVSSPALVVSFKVRFARYSPS